MTGKEMTVHACANGVRCAVMQDDEDGALVIFDTNGFALGYVDYPGGTAEWIVTAERHGTGERKPAIRYGITCSKCKRKRWYARAVNAEELKQRNPFCECGAKIVGVRGEWKRTI